MNERMYYSEAAKRRAMAERVAIALGAAVLGAGIGSILALLFAPSDGDANRDAAQSQLQNVVDKTKETMADAYDSAQHKAQNLQETASEYVDSMSNGMGN